MPKKEETAQKKAETTESVKLKRFSFPKHGIVIEAETRELAEAKLKEELQKSS